MVFKDYLKKARAESGLTQRQLAERSGISYSYLTKLESGEQANPTRKVLEALSSVFGGILRHARYADDNARDLESVLPVEPTKEQREIGELAKPLAEYIEANKMHCAVVIVTMGGVALYWEGFTAEYADDFRHLTPPRTPGLSR